MVLESQVITRSVAVPYTDTSKPRKKEFQWKVTQPIPESQLITRGQWITCEEFEDMNKAMNTDDKVKDYE
jgi:hypothetical protein